MEVHVPIGLGSVQFYTLTGEYVPLLERSHKMPLSCEGERVLVSEPECIRRTLGDSEGLRVVRFESDVEEDGYYIEAHHLLI